MNSFRFAFSQNFRCAPSLKKSFVSNYNILRYYCEHAPRMPTEKCVNHVTLLGRVGLNPQLRGTEAKPVVVFSLATNINYKHESGEFHQKTEWHRISVFKPYLRETVLEHLTKGSRIYVEGRLSYGEVSDAKGVVHNTTTIIANDIIFISSKKEATYEDIEEDSSVV